MKQKKVKELRDIVRDSGRDEYFRNLATGGFYKNGHEISEEEWSQQSNKVIKIDLGPGQKPK